MLIRFIAGGKSYTIPVTQVVSFTDDGRPVACTYQADGVIVHSDATASDFEKVLSDLGILARPGKVDVVTK